MTFIQMNSKLASNLRLRLVLVGFCLLVSVGAQTVRAQSSNCQTYQVTGPTTITLSGIHSGTRVTIDATLSTSDPSDFQEGESLNINSPGLGSVKLDDPIGGGTATAHFEFTTVQDNEQISAFIGGADGYDGDETATLKICSGPGKCQNGTGISVQLPQVIVPVPSSLKPWEIGYGTLALNFTTVDSGANPDILCTAQSGIGSLPILVRPFGKEFHAVADSVASASLSVFKPSTTGVLSSCNFQGGPTNGCILNGVFSSGAHYAQWHTDGFSTQFHGVGVPFLNSGPLTFWVNLESLGLPTDVTSTQNVGSIVQNAEVYIHTTLIHNLPTIVKYAWFQDPGRVNVLVRDPTNLETGFLPNGTSVAQIPRSFYYQSDTNPAVVVPDFTDGTYQVTVTGLASGPFSLSVLTTNIPRSTAEATVQGNITQGTSVSYTMKVATGRDGMLKVVLFDKCLMDDSTGDLLQFNSTTGDYQFTRCTDGSTLTGTGVIRTINSIVYLTDSKPDRRISAGLLIGQLTGSATIIRIYAGGLSQTFRISDTNPHPTCACH